MWKETLPASSSGGTLYVSGGLEVFAPDSQHFPALYTLRLALENCPGNHREKKYFTRDLQS